MGFHAKIGQEKKGQGSKARDQRKNGANQLQVLRRNGQRSKLGIIYYEEMLCLPRHWKGSGLSSDTSRSET